MILMNDPRRAYATSLLSDVTGATGYLPRRDILADWLRGYLNRPPGGSHDGLILAKEDLLAINAHLLAHSVVPATVRVSLN
jgi:hypothetical protein